tara:strand:- start:4310 stop:4558 length:249 start_codon:yes stop_codon:yes gene_type:complete
MKEAESLRDQTTARKEFYLPAHAQNPLLAGSILADRRASQTRIDILGARKTANRGRKQQYGLEKMVRAAGLEPARSVRTGGF